MASAKYKLELRAGFHGGQFQATDGRHIELDEKNPVYETSDANEYAALLALPFLKPVSEKAAG